MTKHQTIPVLPVQDRIRGCLIGGAAGDALGYPVEFSVSRRYATAAVTAASGNICSTPSAGQHASRTTRK